MQALAASAALFVALTDAAKLPGSPRYLPRVCCMSGVNKGISEEFLSQSLQSFALDELEHEQFGIAKAKTAVKHFSSWLLFRGPV